MKGRSLRLAVVANEFLAPGIGRTGGFGWAARAVARAFRAHPEVGIDVVFLTGEIRSPDGARETALDGTRLLFKQRKWWEALPALRQERIDLILTVDYRPSYHRLFWLLPRTPIIVWARDPRTPDDVSRIDTLRIPGQEDVLPQGIGHIDCTSLASMARRSRLVGRKIVVASKFPHIADKLVATYGMGGTDVLPNPDVFDYTLPVGAKHLSPRIAFLARLDPYKRPWLFVELARRFPEVEFLLLGRCHFQGPGSWQPAELPANVKVMGHVEGEEKRRLLASSWVLVNTSIYEESPVSMLEALACETPVLSCVDTGGIAARFGVYAGRFDGTGLEGLPALEAGLRQLLENCEARERLGREGRAWVMREHSTERFLEAFGAIVSRLGMRTGSIAPEYVPDPTTIVSITGELHGAQRVSRSP